MSQRFDLAVVHRFEALDKQTMSTVFGQLKNAMSERIWAITPKQTNNWRLTEFVALGFVKDQWPDTCPWISYSYNLESYNRKRDWNNPRFWANPENWHIRF